MALGQLRFVSDRMSRVMKTRRVFITRFREFDNERSL
ncbi:hypothetical protein UA16_01229 [Burkholderia multivorans]|nr:hypothetical protein UA14_01188 [Burkholderia multivorans]SAK30361.1 hypothetical protein UA16_01229 [Burkholderia multivorans]